MNSETRKTYEQLCRQLGSRTTGMSLGASLAIRALLDEVDRLEAENRIKTQWVDSANSEISRLKQEINAVEIREKLKGLL